MKLGRQFKMSELLNHCKRKFFECNIHDKSSDTYEVIFDLFNKTHHVDILYCRQQLKHLMVYKAMQII